MSKPPFGFQPPPGGEDPDDPDDVTGAGSTPGNQPPHGKQPQPGSGDAGQGDGPADPFAFLAEAFGAAFGGNLGGAGGAAGLGLGDLGGLAGLAGLGGLGGAGGGLPGLLFSEIGRMMSGQGGSGPVNWDLARRLAEDGVKATDAPVDAAARTAVSEGLRLADLWLEPLTSLPSGVLDAQCWSRKEWITKTLPVWRTLCEPVAARVAQVLSGTISGALADPGQLNEMLGQLPIQIDAEQLRAAAGSFSGVFGQLGGLMFGVQMGQALAALAADIVGSTEIGLPLGPQGHAALLAQNVTAFGEGLEVPEQEVLLYLALRETAHHRLYGHVPWLRSHVLAAVEDYARGIAVDPQALQTAFGQLEQLDLSGPPDPDQLRQLLGDSVFQDAVTDAQKAALRRLETILALIEGWVDVVVDAAADGRLPAAAALRETVRRRRASGGPAEQTFAALVGLDLRPRRLRDASALWLLLTGELGIDERDKVWEHPDLLPTSDDLERPQDFLAARRVAEQIPDDLSGLLNEGAGQTDTAPEAPPGPDEGPEPDSETD